MRRKAVQDRDQELQDIATALVHRIGGLTGDIPTQLDQIRAAAAAYGLDPAGQQIVGAAAAHIEKRGRRLKDLLPSLREIANLNFVTFQPVELGSLLSEVVADLLPAPSPIDPYLQLEPNLIVEGNRNLLRDALRSLLENGCEAMPNGGQLAVRLVSLPSGRAHIQIKDTGIGIMDKHKSSMFHLGFSTKGENGRDSNRGLGMFTCRAIVRRHGGEIDIESQEGYGTVVTITLPLLGI
jgi:signal transduction histidine kinase